MFTVIRSTKEEPDCVPAVSPRVRRRLSSWPPGQLLYTAQGVPRRRRRHRVRTASGPDPPGSSRCRFKRRKYAGSSRTPLHHARRTRTIWQCWIRPGFVRAAPTLPGTTRIRLPSASPPCCDRTAAQVFHLRSNQQRLTAQTRSVPEPDETVRASLTMCCHGRVVGRGRRRTRRGGANAN